MTTKTLLELAAEVDGEVVGDPTVVISDLDALDSAGPGDISFITKAGLAREAEKTGASALIVPLDMGEIRLPAIRVKDPGLAAAVIHNLFYRRPAPAPGVSHRAHTGDGCRIAESAAVAPFACLGNRVCLGEGVVVEPGVMIADDTTVGAGTIIEANVTIREGCRIGEKVIIHSGAVIGSDGFGYATDENGRHVKRPQVGRVVIEDEVEIGANTCIDRATFGTTRIRAGSKIDNLVQIGHNVEVGEGCILVSQSGIAGSSRIGRGVIMAGQAGIGDHVEVGDRVVIAGRAGVNSNVKSGQTVAGFPAISYREWLRAATAFSRIPNVIKEVRQLRREMEELAALAKGKENEDER